MEEPRPANRDAAPPPSRTLAIAIEDSFGRPQRQSGGDAAAPAEWWRRLLGLEAGRSLWGLEPYDLRPSLGSGTQDVESTQMRRKSHSTGGGAVGLRGPRMFWRVPRRRHVWGESQYELHAGWGELFLDLIFVGAAYRLGKVIKFSFYSCDPGPAHAGGERMLEEAAYGYGDRPQCVGALTGVLWTVALFQVVHSLWLADLHYRARYDATDSFHRATDLLGHLMLVYGSANIRPVHEYAKDIVGFASFVGPCAGLQLLWLLRWLEIGLLSRDEESRRFSASRLVDDGPIVLLWIASLLVALYTPQGGAHPAAAALLLLGGYWTDLRQMWRVWRAVWLKKLDAYLDASPRASAASAPASRGKKVKHPKAMPKARTRVPINVEFAIHRFNEFMMLMIGECILTLVLQQDETGAMADTTWEHAVTLISGFGLAVALLYSFNISEPHHATGDPTPPPSPALAPPRAPCVSGGSPPDARPPPCRRSRLRALVSRGDVVPLPSAAQGGEHPALRRRSQAGARRPHRLAHRALRLPLPNLPHRLDSRVLRPPAAAPAAAHGLP